MPQPDGPSSVRNSPTATSRLRPCSAVIERRSVKKRTCRLRQLTARPPEAGGRAPSVTGDGTATASAIAQALRAACVALRMSSVITSSTFGVRAVNWPSSLYSAICSCQLAGSMLPQPCDLATSPKL